MKETSTIVRHSLSQIKAMGDRGETKPAPKRPKPNF